MVILKNAFIVFCCLVGCGEQVIKEVPQRASSPVVFRQSVETCDDFRPASLSNSCTTECEDGENGRCRVFQRSGEPSPWCTYDECSQDSDCPTDNVCSCGKDNDIDGFIRSDANACVPSNCRTNADCSVFLCRGTYSCGLGQITGYFCTTPEDTCVDDSDCAWGSFCEYQPAAKSWACTGSCGEG